MDYEEKYKKALATARKLYNMRGDWTNLEIESIFPELRESEDERIRKALMQNLKERFGTKGNMGEGLDMPDVLAWFEKKKESQPIEWSKEDEQFKIERKAILNDAIAHLRFLASIEKNKVSLSYIQRDIDWIKENLPFLRPQSTWKPSDEQIGLLQAIVNAPNNASSESCQIVLKEVIKQLKKLKD